MRALTFALLLTACILISCKKENPAPNPASVFTVNEYGGFGMTYIDTAFFIGTHDAFVFRNQSTNFNTIHWDFGNGLTSSRNDTVISFDKPGIYNVTLTAINSDGVKNVSSRKFTVFERVIKDFSIDRFEMNMFGPSQNNLPVFTKMDLWLELKQSVSPTDTYTDNGDISGAVVLYRSPVFKDIDSSFHGSLNFALTDKVLLSYPVNNIIFPGNTGLGFMINLYGKDNSGSYLLASSRWSGIGITFIKNARLPNSKDYTMQTWVAGSTTSITVNCAYQ